MWEFDADTGDGVNPTSACLNTYPCQVADDGTIMVDVGR
jgi:nitrite reductase/ring-hydroxylating ferredoxin subunit